MRRESAGHAERARRATVSREEVRFGSDLGDGIGFIDELQAALPEFGPMTSPSYAWSVCLWPRGAWSKNLPVASGQIRIADQSMSGCVTPSSRLSILCPISSNAILVGMYVVGCRGVVVDVLPLRMVSSDGDDPVEHEDGQSCSCDTEVLLHCLLRVAADLGDPLSPSSCRCFTDASVA